MPRILIGTARTQIEIPIPVSARGQKEDDGYSVCAICTDYVDRAERESGIEHEKKSGSESPDYGELLDSSTVSSCSYAGAQQQRNLSTKGPVFVI